VPLSDSSGARPPFVVCVEEKCEDCGGSGHDCGSLSPLEPKECPACHGSGKQVSVHNYLVEALRIAAGNSSLLTQREYLLAVIQHCRSLVGALMASGDIR
jgi:RecJ-like exonuclease